jgi:hypothetical protein
VRIKHDPAEGHRGTGGHEESTKERIRCKERIFTVLGFKRMDFIREFTLIFTNPKKIKYLGIKPKGHGGAQAGR